MCNVTPEQIHSAMSRSHERYVADVVDSIEFELGRSLNDEEQRQVEQYVNQVITTGVGEVEGMTRVPIVPTMEQLIAGRKQITSATGKMSRLMRQRLADVYRAMVAAAKGE